MRCLLTKRGHPSNHTDAACWQANNPAKDACIAEIHLAQSHLTLDNIIHECSHAAFHRTVILGLKPTDDRFQEWIASDTGYIADALVALFHKHRTHVRYHAVKRRLF